jgi:hypothetical protein
VRLHCRVHHHQLHHQIRHALPKPLAIANAFPIG